VAKALLFHFQQRLQFLLVFWFEPGLAGCTNSGGSFKRAAFSLGGQLASGWQQMSASAFEGKQVGGRNAARVI
jgi:hypothetical protein